MTAEWLQKAGELVRARIADEGSKRFGTETEQSHMQTVDPMRPQGVYVGSLRVAISADEARVGPTVPYDWWIERGSEAPEGVPDSHKRAEFRGHRPVERGAEKAIPEIGGLLNQMVLRELDKRALARMAAGAAEMGGI